MTISAWIKSAAFPVDDAAIVSKRTDATELGYQLTPLWTRAAQDRVQAHQRLRGEDVPLRDEHAAAHQCTTDRVYDASAQTLDVYLNGNLDNGTLIGR